MNQEQLLDVFRRASDIAHDPTSDRTTKTRARKDAVLAELETAHLLMYQQRAEQAIQAELDRRAQPKDDGKKFNKNNNLENIIIDNNSLIEKEYFSKDKYDFGTPKKPKPEDPKATVKRNMAFNLAQTSVQLDQGLVRFRQRIDRLESTGDESTLESLLNASHNMAVTAPHSAQEFLTTIEAIPEEDSVPYAIVVSHLFRDQTSSMDGNSLVWRLRQIQPRFSREGLGKFFREREERDTELDLIKSLTHQSINKYENKYISDLNDDKLFYSERRSNPLESVNSLELIGLGSALKDVLLGLTHGIGYASLTKSGALSSHENTSFFSDLQEIYRRVGAEKARKWLEQANAFFGEDWKIGRDFAVRSRPTFVAYENDFGWDLDQFVEDYKKMGDSVFELAGFSSKFAGLGDKRRRNVARSLISTVSGSEIKELTGNKLPKEQVALVGRLLPEETTPQEIITAIKRTADLYAQCDQNRVDNRLVTSRLGRVQKAGSLDDYLKAAGEVGQQADRYIEFANEQRRDPNMNLGFNDSQTQATLDLYETFLGKNFEQFRRDFQATGTDFQRLPEIRDRYGKFLDEERLRAMLNYVAKQRSRDLIKDLVITKTPEALTKKVVEKLGKNGSKRELVRGISELNKVYSFLSGLDYEVLAHIENNLFSAEGILTENNHKQGFFRRLFHRRRNDYQPVLNNLNRKIGVEGIVEETLSKLPSDCSSEDVIQVLNGIKREVYATVTGGVEVPRELEDVVGNIVVAYHKNTGRSEGVNIRPALEFIVSNYLQHGAQQTFQAIRELEPNRKVRKSLEKRGVNVEAFKKGIERTYHVSTDEGSLSRLREKINAEFEQVYDRLGQLELEEGQLEELREGGLREQLEKVEKFVSKYEFNDETKALKPEIKGHIQTARSMTGSIKEMEADARFYVSQDPFEALHMGQYFGSCLSLAKNHCGMNGWASVVQTMDSNKNVIYARAEDGRYLGRNRTALTDQGVLCTRFYQNGDMNLNDAWVNYLEAFADHTGQDVMVPTTFAPLSMTKVFEEKMGEGRIKREQRSVRIKPAYFSAFYGDGLSTRKTLDGAVQVDAEVYVIKPTNYRG